MAFHRAARFSTVSAVVLIALGHAAIAQDQSNDATNSLMQPGNTELAADVRDSIDVTYNGYFLGLRVMKAVVNIDEVDDAYAVEAGFRTAGLLGFFADAEINAKAQGITTDSGLQPLEYEHRNLKSSKNRIIRIGFDQGIATPDVTPPFGSAGDPAPTIEDLTGAFDPLSTIMALATDNGGCGQTVPVFDGKQRYDLRFTEGAETTVRVRGYEGRALKCDVFYTPISGFDPEDLAEPEVYDKPFEVWLPLEKGYPTVPVRIRGDVSGLGVSIEARSVSKMDSPK